jgi:superfamily II DNA or RNA helicase
MSTWSHFDDPELIRTFGRATYERGRAYAARGAVCDLEVQGLGGAVTLLTGLVEGSRDYAYEANVTLVDQPAAPWLDSRCTCPVGRLCKHAVALVVRAREAEPPAGPEWERLLDDVLDELTEAAEGSTTPTRGLGLEVGLALPQHQPRGRPAVAGDLPVAGRVRLRPLQRTPRGKWGRTHVSWTEVPHLESRADVDLAQARALTQLLAAHQVARRQVWSAGEPTLELGAFGPGVWSLLAQAVEAGVVLVPGRDLRSVRLETTPLQLELDVHGADRDDDAHLELGVAHQGSWYAGPRVELLTPPGDARRTPPGHGVALWDGEPGLWDLVVAPLDRPAGARTARALRAGRQLALPASEVPRLASDYLPRLQRHLPVSSSDASIVVSPAPRPRLALAVTWKAVDEVAWDWGWRYRVGADDRVYGLEETRGLRGGVRDPLAEGATLAALELDEEQTHRLCGGRREQGLLPAQVLTGAPVIAFVEETLRPLERSGQVEIEEVGHRPTFQELHEAPEVSFTSAPEQPGASTPTDWLDLQVVIRIGDRPLGLAQVLEAMTQGAERVILRDGTHLRIDRPEFAELRALVMAARELVEQPQDGVRVSRSDLGLWAELADLGIVDAQASAWTRAALALRDLVDLPAVEPVHVDADLRPYQLDGFRWLAFLWDSGLGGILADDMGLGKTLQTLALVAHARASGGAPFLVVAPTSVVATWAHEAAAFTPGLVARTVTESRARRGASLAEAVAGADLVITSYTLYRMEAAEYAALEWGGLVLDEAQTVKNHEGKTYQAVRRLEVPFRLALTGTPMENRLLELWSLLSIVAPGLYPYPDRFKETVADPVEKEGDEDVLARFRRRIRPFLLRRTKDLVARDLPPKQEQVLEVTLTPKHRRIYQTHLQRERQHVLGLLGDFDRQRMAIFTSLTRLRQLSLDASLVDEEYAGTASAKVDVLLDHLQEVLAEGHRALVFSQFTSFLRLVRDRLDAEGITSTYLDGTTRKRAQVVADFKQGAAGVFLISLKAGGVGLTLTEADYVFVLDPWWNPAVEAQAVDRAHRIGQQRPVIVYRLVSTDTIEEKVMALKARKADLFARVLDGGGGTSTPLSADDVRELFS